MRSLHPGLHCPAALALAILLIACGSRTTLVTAASGPVATVETALVVSGDVSQVLETLGSVELDPKQTRTVALVTSGQVLQVLVAPGQGVSAGTELLTLGPLPANSLEVQQARIDLEFARRELARLQRMRDGRLATNEQVQQAEKSVANAQAVLDGMGGRDPEGAPRAARAPFSGTVREVMVTAGAIVHTGEPAVTLAPADGVVARTGFEAEDLGELRIGLPATIRPVLGGEESATAAGALSELHRIVDPDTQLVEAVVRVASAPPWMLPGTSVRVHVVTRSAVGVVLVPRAALLTRDGVDGVFVVDGGVAHWAALEIGIRGRDTVEVRSGLTAGARVVTTGRSVLSDGMAVVEAGTSAGTSS